MRTCSPLGCGLDRPASIRLPGRGLALLFSLLLAACGGGGGATDTPATQSTGTTASAGSATGSVLSLLTSLLPTTGAPTTPSPAPAASAAPAADTASTTAPAASTALTAAPAPTTPTTPTTPTLTVRARGDLAAGVGPQMTVRLNGKVLGVVEVRSTTYADYAFSAPDLAAGGLVDVVFGNDAVIDTEDRNLFVAYLSDGQQVVLPSAPGAVLDRGTGAQAFDGFDTVPGQGDIWSNAALRLTWPAASAATNAATATATAATQARKLDAARFLMQASFGPTTASVDSLVNTSYSAWITAQIALPYGSDYVDHVQSKFALGDAWRPQGSSYTPIWVAEKFWQTAANAPDQLRRRVAFALQQMLVVSMADSNLYHQSRPYAAYLDTLNRNAFGNYRNLLEEVALSPAMGIYLSHMRNRKEDAATGRQPDENFARELMQLFAIGLVELNIDGTLQRDAQGKAIETYTNADVMALAKVFTGWSWAYPDSELTDANFRWGSPPTSAAADKRIDMLPMKAYPGQHSTAEKKLFTGKAWAAVMPAGGSAQADLKIALDTLFKHPNVGPFVSRQLIQRLVASNPSAAYVGRVAAVFNNNGQGTRGDMAAVVRAVLLDAEARTTATAQASKLREPVLRVAHWMRALGARSVTGQFQMGWEMINNSQQALHSPSVFNHFRPGYVPPNTRYTAQGATVPEFQIVNESTVAAWINDAQRMATGGIGWTGSASDSDVMVDHAALGALASGGNLLALVDQLNLLLLGGRMQPATRQAILDAAGSAAISSGATGTAAATQLATNRASAAVFLTLASPEYSTQP